MHASERSLIRNLISTVHTHAEISIPSPIASVKYTYCFSPLSHWIIIGAFTHTKTSFTFPEQRATRIKNHTNNLTTKTSWQTKGMNFKHCVFNMYLKSEKQILFLSKDNQKSHIQLQTKTIILTSLREKKKISQLYTLKPC